MVSLKIIKSDCSQEIHRLINQYKLIKVEKTLSTTESFINFAQTLGQLYEWPFGVVNELKVDINTKNYLYSEEAVPFHWDGAFARSPHLLLFHCVASLDQNAGGETLFTDSEALFNSFEPDEQALLKTISIHYETEKLAHYGGTITQNIVDIHPHTQRPTLRFAEMVHSNKNPVKRIILDNNAKKNRLVQQLEKRLYQRRFCYSHRWKAGELIIADNHALLHGRIKLQHNTSRHIRRIQVL